MCALVEMKKNTAAPWKAPLFILAAILAISFLFLAFSGQQTVSVVSPSPPAQAPSVYVADEAKGIVCKDCNVVLLSFDSVRADRIGAYGYSKNTTPNLDRFASNAALFENFIVQSHITPVSMMSILKSQYPSVNGMVSFVSPLSENSRTSTLAQVLKANGYATGAIATSPEYTGYMALKQGFEGGFDEFSQLSVSGERRLPEMSAVSKWIRNHSNKKFFLWIADGSAHWPYGYAASENARKKFLPKDYDGILGGMFPTWYFLRQLYYDRYYAEPGGSDKDLEFSEKDYEYLNALYDAGIFSVDEFLGGFFQLLESEGLLDNTVVVFHGVHGEAFGEKGYVGHTDVLDSQIREPLVVFVPGVAAKRVKAQVAGLDVAPTILEILELEIPPEMTGKSLLSFLR